MSEVTERRGVFCVEDREVEISSGKVRRIGYLVVFFFIRRGYLGGGVYFFR